MDEASQPITPEERERRDEAVRSAQASLFLSGFEVSSEGKVHARRFIEGEIYRAQFVRGGGRHNVSIGPDAGQAGDSE